MYGLFCDIWVLVWGLDLGFLKARALLWGSQEMMIAFGDLDSGSPISASCHFYS